jgi:hypothetical protein
MLSFPMIVVGSLSSDVFSNVWYEIMIGNFEYGNMYMEEGGGSRG